VDLANGVMNATAVEVPVKRLAMRAAQEVVPMVEAPPIGQSPTRRGAGGPCCPRGKRGEARPPLAPHHVTHVAPGSVDPRPLPTSGDGQAACAIIGRTEEGPLIPGATKCGKVAVAAMTGLDVVKSVIIDSGLGGDMISSRERMEIVGSAV
jgi:DeoR/GlpR family transcriptional regulator of sugar metabolism